MNLENKSAAVSQFGIDFPISLSCCFIVVIVEEAETSFGLGTRDSDNLSTGMRHTSFDRVNRNKYAMKSVDIKTSAYRIQLLISGHSIFGNSL